MTETRAIPSVSVTYARNGSSTKANALGMRPMQERAYQKRGEQYPLIKSPGLRAKADNRLYLRSEDGETYSRCRSFGSRYGEIYVLRTWLSALTASAPLMRAARAAARKRSRSPPSTAPVLPVSTPVRRSFTI
jgi:hypothetical protein